MAFSSMFSGCSYLDYHSFWSCAYLIGADKLRCVMWFGPGVGAFGPMAARSEAALDGSKSAADEALTPAPGKAGRGMPGRPSLLWIAVAETIWAEDMEAMLWRALSFTAWSLNSSHKRLSTHTERGGGVCCRGSNNQILNNTLKAPLTSLTTENSKQVKRRCISIAI